MDAHEVDPAEKAFNDLAAEVAVLRRTVDALPDAWKAAAPPDYTPTLTAVRQQLGAVADALAPFVVRTVRTEVEANSDQLPAKLYPHIGVMVRDYVRSAIRDLMEDINQRLEDGLTKNRLSLRLRSWSTGRSMAELALADTGRFEVDELHLIRRGSGELLAHWSRSAAEGSSR